VEKLALSSYVDQQQSMTRDEALNLYRPVRAGIQRVLKVAPSACNQSDWMRAAKHLGVWSGDGISVDDEAVIEMATDIALFEPNQRKKRAYDRFLDGPAQSLDPADLDLARRIGTAFFSIFQLVGRHPGAGVWVEDILDRNRRIWILDEGLEASAPGDFLFSMRIFDAGPFHAGFGIVVPVDEETAHFCAQARARGGPLPVRDSLAATLYSDDIRARTPLSLVEVEMVSEFLDLLTQAPPEAGNRLTKPRNRPKRGLRR
jgi:hypothetical protein